MTPEKAICLKFIECINSREFKELSTILHDDAVLLYPSVPAIRKKGMVVMFFRQLRSKFSRLHFTAVRVIQEGSELAVEWENAGIRTGGVSYSNQGVSVIKIHDAKIILISDYFKQYLSGQ